eukprot:c2935_g1_i1.p1 GENE.c2935_g1_i1~~c2935_g1_i1.p1  ORF type:complete len:489 (-),score=88.18 c2935_g1_i1:574-2007(-)
MTTITELNNDVLLAIASNLNGFDLTRLSSVCRRFRTLCVHDSLWKSACLRDFNLSERRVPVIPPQQTTNQTIETNNSSERFPSTRECATFRDAHAAIRKICAEEGEASIDGGKLYRAARCFETLCSWYRTNLPEVITTLNPGINRGQWLEGCSKINLDPLSPAATTLWSIYRCYNGQRIIFEEDNRTMDMFFGMFGGFSAYSNIVCTRLFKFQKSVDTTIRMRSANKIQPTHIAFACSFNRNRFFCIDTRTGLVVFYPTHQIHYLRAVPEGDKHVHDGLLRWFEHFASSLQGEMYAVGPILPQSPDLRGIVLFARSGPRFRQCVTRGVLVTATSMWTPNMDTGFIYSITVRLLVPGDEGYQTREQRGFDTAQLRDRHWNIIDGPGQPKHVRGPGVVGKFPLIQEGGFWDHNQDTIDDEAPFVEGTFVYQSCSGLLSSEEASFGGEFTFVFPNLSDPVDEFDVIVPRFPLVPQVDYHF